jgi:hypothetical protein
MLRRAGVSMVRKAARAAIPNANPIGVPRSKNPKKTIAINNNIIRLSFDLLLEWQEE